MVEFLHGGVSLSLLILFGVVCEEVDGFELVLVDVCGHASSEALIPDDVVERDDGFVGADLSEELVPDDGFSFVLHEVFVLVELADEVGAAEELLLLVVDDDHDDGRVEHVQLVGDRFVVRSVDLSEERVPPR